MAKPLPPLAPQDPRHLHGAAPSALALPWPELGLAALLWLLLLA